MRFPNQDFRTTDDAGKPSLSDTKWRKGVQRAISAVSEFLKTGWIVVGNPDGGETGDGSINAETLYECGKRVFVQGGLAEAGLDHSWIDHGTMSSGTLTIDPLEGFHHKVTIAGAVSIEPASDRVGSCILHITNGASADASFSGWNYKFSGSITKTLNDRFWVPMYFGGSEGADYMIQRRQ